MKVEYDYMIKFNFIKRMFFIGPRPKELRCMLSLTPNAHKALTYLAEQSGETIQQVIYDVLEQYLVHALDNKVIAKPDSVVDSLSNDEQAS